MVDEDTCVRVAVRIPTQIAHEKIDLCRVCTTVTPGDPQIALGTGESFIYDYVFDMDSTQQNVYDRCVASFVDGSLQGYSAAILAYGQTGSGKTYSMGSGFDVDLQPEQVGVIPRAISHLFDGIRGLREAARECGQPPPELKVVAPFMELYKREAHRLLRPGPRLQGQDPDEDPRGRVGQHLRVGSDVSRGGERGGRPGAAARGRRVTDHRQLADELPVVPPPRHLHASRPAAAPRQD